MSLLPIYTHTPDFFVCLFLLPLVSGHRAGVKRGKRNTAKESCLRFISLSTFLLGGSEPSMPEGVLVNRWSGLGWSWGSTREALILPLPYYIGDDLCTVLS